ncbi:MAG: VWA domain-containing protein [Ruminococcus flavefaciens]|nr:VWA domain-containing protein [Ruminococcus flavefaciens]
MSKTVNIVVDASGSMAEDDKNAVVKYLLNGISNITDTSDFYDVNFVLYQWGQSSKKIEDIGKAKIEFSGKSPLSGLEELKQIMDGTQTMIFVSDGNFNSGDKAHIKKMSEKIIPIFVGIDANRTMLQDIATERVVYSVTDFMQAIYDACS